MPAAEPERGELRILWYNVENLYHPDNDTIPGDDDFTPDGVRGWSFSRYGMKITALCKVIIAAGIWEPPELVGLCEVEDARVLDDLVEHPILAPYGYRYVQRDSPDPRGMDVACLYREEMIGLTGFDLHHSDPSGTLGGTRDILHLNCRWGSGEDLDLFLVHLVSKFGGAGATAEPRREQVVHLVHLVDSVYAIRGSSLKVLAGDFNEVLEGYSMEPARTGSVGGKPIAAIPLEGHYGSYKYRGRWSCIDHFMACGDEGYRLRGSILELPRLLSRDETYGGVMPRRTYTGFRYNGGISDHLPACLDISAAPSSDSSEQ